MQTLLPGKAISITYSECMLVALVIQKRPRNKLEGAVTPNKLVKIMHTTCHPGGRVGPRDLRCCRKERNLLPESVPKLSVIQSVAHAIRKFKNIIQKNAVKISGHGINILIT